MARRARKTFWGDFKKFFVRGLGILLPSVLTLWILVMAYQFVVRNVAEPINAGIRQVVIKAAPTVIGNDPLPEWFIVSEESIQRVRAERLRQGLRPMGDAALRAQIRERNFREWWNDRFYLRAIGLVVAIVLIYLAGLLLGGFIGRRVYHRVERFFERVPVFKQVYPHVKQVVEFLFGEQQKAAFRRVVLVEYPRKGVWTVGLMTGASMRGIEDAADGRCITVFIPSSPTPFTGYTITVREEDAIDIPITIDEALRFVVTGGVLVPQSQAVTKEQLEEAARRGELGSLGNGKMRVDSDEDEDAG
ncbi:MAG: DUF502 domain-containing protein [Planctomycetota bacterium]|nr:DUF502 domain-containing protein [Planctomycetota bacterium]